MKFADPEVVSSGSVPAVKWGSVQFAQMILDEQGHMILGCDDPNQKAGDILAIPKDETIFGIESEDLGPLVIAGFVPRSEFIAQIERYYPDHVKPAYASTWRRYATVIAE